MRLFGFALMVSLLTGVASAEPVFDVGDRRVLSLPATSSDFQLGGSTSRTAIAPDSPLKKPSIPTLKLAMPSLMRETSISKRKTAFGGLSITFGESWDGREIYHLGTALTRGQTTAGVKVTYEDGQSDFTSSELFVDYALSESFSLGVSGALSNSLTSDADPVPYLGINAEISGNNGAFLQGGVADVDDDSPVFGLAIGFKF